jgi:hypothetical protein
MNRNNLIIGLVLFTVLIGGGLFAVEQFYGLSNIGFGPFGIEETASGQACNVWERVICNRDDPSVCSDSSTSNPVFSASYGQAICTGANDPERGPCTIYDACAPLVIEGQSCTGNYISLPSEQLIRFSSGEADRGSFVGCEAAINPNTSEPIGSTGRNCFCEENVSNGSGFTSGTVVCLEDRNNDSCAASEIIIQSTPTPEPTPSDTPIPTNTPNPTNTPVATDTPMPSMTIEPTITNTPTPTPTLLPTITSTAIPTNTMMPTATPTILPTITETMTPTPTMMATSIPTQIPTTSELPKTSIGDDDLIFIKKILLGILIVMVGLLMYIIMIWGNLDINTLMKLFKQKDEDSKKKELEKKLSE